MTLMLFVICEDQTSNVGDVGVIYSIQEFPLMRQSDGQKSEETRILFKIKFNNYQFS